MISIWRPFFCIKDILKRHGHQVYYVSMEQASVHGLAWTVWHRFWASDLGGYGGIFGCDSTMSIWSLV